MAKRAKPQEACAKIVIYTRIDPTTVAALDEICESMRPKPTRAQLIDAALAEYVERHKKVSLEPEAKADARPTGARPSSRTEPPHG